ncbi:LRR receptor-like serine threonine-protein kinase [Seminavis robusta]|uniref:LRR receptor-like serine threonine-protein kinase n=1 Tax=Seminavis robusta TaxID=568900 RepID=A0A9N8E7T5_9STRA|nr:LRR receptor-like serine threonine-protein kinase [Seminavis robusta]|eukprot:Sro775_g200840.1 LRR receptor-like serine threonine-protein kinase (815) ;mRNA; f:30311-32755
MNSEEHCNANANLSIGEEEKQEVSLSSTEKSNAVGAVGAAGTGTTDMKQQPSLGIPGAFPSNGQPKTLGKIFETVSNTTTPSSTTSKSNSKVTLGKVFELQVATLAPTASTSTTCSMHKSGLKEGCKKNDNLKRKERGLVIAGALQTARQDEDKDKDEDDALPVSTTSMHSASAFSLPEPQSLPSPPTVQQQQSQPGAFPQAPFGVTVDPLSYLNEPQTEYYYNDNGNDMDCTNDNGNAVTSSSLHMNEEQRMEEGLVEAKPVPDDDENTARPTAEPYHNHTKRPSQETLQQDLHAKERMAVIVVAVVGLILVLVLVTTLVVVASTKDDLNSNSNSPAILNGSEVPTTAAPTSWQWDLPFPIPDFVQEEIRSDYNMYMYDSDNDNNNNTISSSTVTNANKSPQTRAYEWMKQDPAMLMETSTTSRWVQRFVLATLYYSTRGEEWTHQGGGTVTVTLGQGPLSGDAPQQQQQPTGQGQGGRPPATNQIRYFNVTSDPWLSYGINTTECNWFSPAFTERETACFSNNHNNNNDTINGGSNSMYQVLDASRNNLQGSMPQEIGLLSSLESLNLGWNPQLVGPIVTQIGQLTSLREIVINSCSLTGSVPKEIGLLNQTLEICSLLDNDFRGTLPREFWALTNLKEIKLGQTQLSGSIPEDKIGLFSNLQIFMVGRTLISGQLPSSIGRLSNNLQVLDVQKTRGTSLSSSSSSLTGTLPTQLGRLGNVTRFLAAGNWGVQGVLPSEIGTMSRLRSLNLEDMPGLSGPIPPELGNLNLNHLKIKGTSLTGTIPPSLCGVRELTVDCSDKLCGCHCPCATN